MPDSEPEQSQKSVSPVIPHWHDSDSEVVTITSGDGARVYDGEGNEYLDFISMLYCVNAGHGQDSIVDALSSQASQIGYVSPSKHSDVRDELATRLGEIAPQSLSDTFFSVSGSEANEAAVQFAREHTGSHKVLTRWRSYHGGTYGAAGLTGDPETRAVVERYAATTGSGKFLPPMVHRSPFGDGTPTEIADKAANHLEFVIRNEGPESIAAIVMEPIAGTSGAYPAPPGYFQQVRELCDDYDILLIADEVITGFGRCGDWFGMSTEDVEPDMITFAKGITSAYVPLGGVITRPEIGRQLRESGISIGQTFAGHPVGCAAGLAALDLYENSLIENVQTLAPTLESRLQSLAEKHEVIADVRGRGFLWSVEFANPVTEEPFFDSRVDEGTNPVASVRKVAEEHGVLFGSGRPDFQILISPPLCIDESDIELAVQALNKGIDAIFE